MTSNNIVGYQYSDGGALCLNHIQDAPKNTPVYQTTKTYKHIVCRICGRQIVCANVTKAEIEKDRVLFRETLLSFFTSHKTIPLGESQKKWEHIYVSHDNYEAVIDQLLEEGLLKCGILWNEGRRIIGLASSIDNIEPLPKNFGPYSPVHTLHKLDDCLRVQILQDQAINIELFANDDVRSEVDKVADFFEQDVHGMWIFLNPPQDQNIMLITDEWDVDPKTGDEPYLTGKGYLIPPLAEKDIFQIMHQEGYIDLLEYKQQ